MIQVFVAYVDSHFRSITLKGHGNGEKGEDLVCAGVSSCFIGAINALNDDDSHYESHVSSGDSSLVAKQNPSQHDEIVLETLIAQLKTIEFSHPKDVKIKISKKEG